jgi:nicotinamidase-related amidase
MWPRMLGLIIAMLIYSCQSNRDIKSEQKTMLKLTLRQRIPENSTFKLENKEVSWKPNETSIIIIDLWDDHHCISAARRVAELALFMNTVAHEARAKGMLIIHAPSDCMEFYEHTEQRKRAEEAVLKKAPIPFIWNNHNPIYEAPIPAKVSQAGCSCDTPEPCGFEHQVWSRENEAIEIVKGDIISDDGQEIYNVLTQDSIKNVIIMGVHTNLCVLGRPFGIRQMVYLGMNTVLCRDLTDSYHRDPGHHFEGLRQIIEHIETYWCPTITSDQLTGRKPFIFAEDTSATGI